MPLLQGDPGAARAGVRERARERRALLGREARLGAGARDSRPDPGARRRPGAGHRTERAGAHLPALLPSLGTIREHHPGSGLGLAITRGFLELNGGRISVESLPGQGTSFVVEFPLVAAESEPVGAHADRGREA